MSEATKRATLKRLRALLDSGALETEVDGVKTKFRSTDEIQQRIRVLETQLGERRRRSRVLRVNMGHR